MIQQREKLIRLVEYSFKLTHYGVEMLLCVEVYIGM